MARASVPREAAVVTRILAWLRELPQCRAVKNHGGAYGQAGEPDIHGSIGGRAFFIEVKRPDPRSQPTELQKHVMQEWAAAGAIVGVARSLDDAKQLLVNHVPQV